MCQFSLEAYKSRSAREGEVLKLNEFKSGTNGFVSPNTCDTAVCLVPGTTVLVASLIKFPGIDLTPGTKATFTEIISPNAPEGRRYHTDALHFEGTPEPILLQHLPEGLTIEVVKVAVAQKTGSLLTEEIVSLVGVD